MLTGKQLVTSEHYERVKLRFEGYEKLVLKEIGIAKREYESPRFKRWLMSEISNLRLLYKWKLQGSPII